MKLILKLLAALCLIFVLYVVVGGLFSFVHCTELATVKCGVFNIAGPVLVFGVIAACLFFILVGTKHGKYLKQSSKNSVSTERMSRAFIAISSLWLLTAILLNTYVAIFGILVSAGAVYLSKTSRTKLVISTVLLLTWAALLILALNN